VTGHWPTGCQPRVDQQFHNTIAHLRHLIAAAAAAAAAGDNSIIASPIEANVLLTLLSDP